MTNEERAIKKIIDIENCNIDRAFRKCELKCSECEYRTNLAEIIVTCHEAISALKKQIPEKAHESEIGNCCPSCGAVVERHRYECTHSIKFAIDVKLNYCPSCGQAILFEHENREESEEENDDYIFPDNSDHRKQRGRTAPNTEDDLK